MMYNKWWKRDEKSCPKTDNDPSKASALNVVNIGGVFVVLFCGLTFAILVAVGEFCLKVNGKNKHPATVNVERDRRLPVNESFWGQIYNTVWHIFYGERCGDDVSGRDKRKDRGGTDCSSCESLRPEGVRYM